MTGSATSSDRVGLEKKLVIRVDGEASVRDRRLMVSFLLALAGGPSPRSLLAYSLARYLALGCVLRLLLRILHFLMVLCVIRYSTSGLERNWAMRDVGSSSLWLVGGVCLLPLCLVLIWAPLFSTISVSAFSLRSRPGQDAVASASNQSTDLKDSPCALARSEGGEEGGPGALWGATATSVSTSVPLLAYTPSDKTAVWEVGVFPIFLFGCDWLLYLTPRCV